MQLQLDAAQRRRACRYAAVSMLVASVFSAIALLQDQDGSPLKVAVLLWVALVLHVKSLDPASGSE